MIPTIHLGYEVGSGREVQIPVRHLAVTGQTQESGKTTTLEALVRRSGLRAIAFVTKRGEGSFGEGRRIQPYAKRDPLRVEANRAGCESRQSLEDSRGTREGRIFHQRERQSVSRRPRHENQYSGEIIE